MDEIAKARIEKDKTMLARIMADQKDMSGIGFNLKYTVLTAIGPICMSVKYNCGILALMECKGYDPGREVGLEDLYRTYLNGLESYFESFGLDYVPDGYETEQTSRPSYEV
jgi:hypothetical protein